MKTFDLLISKRRNHKFSSGVYTGADFREFARDFKTTANTMCSSLGYDLIMGKPGHYYLSGFIRSGDKFVYFSVSDVRSSPDWKDSVLIRTAKDAKDFSGGQDFVPLSSLPSAVSSLLA